MNVTYKSYVIRRKVDGALVAEGTAEQCSAALGMKLTSLHAILGHIAEGTYHKYDFQREGYYDVE